MKKAALILHNIRSVYNVGSIFRTADCVGISKIYLSGYTPSPIDRFGRKRKDFAKVSLGAEESVSWEVIPDIKEFIQKLKKEKFQIIAVEQSQKAVDYKKVQVKSKAVFIYGNEVEGLENEILNLCDITAEIPMRGKLARTRQEGESGKESLNVSVSVGATLFRFLDN